MKGGLGRGEERHSRSLHYAPPDFLWNLVALMHFMRPSLRKGAHLALSSAEWQEILVRSGSTAGRDRRDDTSVWDVGIWYRSIRVGGGAHRRFLRPEYSGTKS